MAGLPFQPTDPRLIVGAVSVALALAGARFYRLATVAPGLAAGLMGGLHFTEGQPLKLRVAICAALALLGAGACYFVERIAIGIAGLIFCAGLTRALLPLIWKGEHPWWAPAAVGLLGLALFPSLYQRMLPVITAVLGGIGVAWAVGQPENLLLIGGVAFVGMVVQIALTGKGSGKDKKKD